MNVRPEAFGAPRQKCLLATICTDWPWLYDLTTNGPEPTSFLSLANLSGLGNEPHTCSGTIGISAPGLAACGESSTKVTLLAPSAVTDLMLVTRPPFAACSFLLVMIAL